LLTFIRLFFSSRVALVAENLFLRKQLALFQERKTTRHRTTASFRLAMVALAKFFNWRNALMIVKPETFGGWHRTLRTADRDPSGASALIFSSHSPKAILSESYVST
jgi:hypothetical protein